MKTWLWKIINFLKTITLQTEIFAVLIFSNFVGLDNFRINFPLVRLWKLIPAKKGFYWIQTCEVLLGKYIKGRSNQPWKNFFLGTRLFGHAVSLARPIVHSKNGWSKPKFTSFRGTTKNIAFRSLLPKQDLQLSF